MDAVEYVKTKHRMCATFHLCNNCPLKGNCGTPNVGTPIDPERNVKAVEEWAKEHPTSTRNREFLKMFPHALTLNGVVNILPCEADFRCRNTCDNFLSCDECRRKYWNEEIE